MGVPRESCELQRATPEPGGVAAPESEGFTDVPNARAPPTNTACATGPGLAMQFALLDRHRVAARTSFDERCDEPLGAWAPVPSWGTSQRPSADARAGAGKKGLTAES